MSILEAILQGIIQGLTEFLPVSSSGHLSVFQHFFGIEGEEAALSTIVMHLGTLVAVFAAFSKKIKKLILEFFSMVKDIFKRKFTFKDMNPNRRMIVMIIVSILPLFGFYIFKDFFSGMSSDSDIILEGCAFLYTSILLFIADRHSDGTKRAGETTVASALTIGIFQGIALVPGISRSGSTISGALLTGMKREDAVEYSFILGIPVIMAGALVQIKDLGSSAESSTIIALVVGFVVSAVTGYFAISLLKWLIKQNKFKVFSIYTLILGIVVISAGVLEKTGVL
ncbi:MAG: undecaprenyl-diphosphate phosphatase [Oscillospiraceae bacterium]|nr:undecaprenyl-diphosphate phosphatase [Oscillospiraceae bacterium]